jgi:hypothetical protein
MVAAAAALLPGCGEVGLTLDVSAKSDVPKLDALRVQVSQGPLLVEQTFGLGSAPLPQSVAIVSKGLTRGSVDVTVQGLSRGRVQGLGHAAGELKPATQALRLQVVLERLCPPGKSMCGCDPVTCMGIAKACGTLDDRCGGERACGSCAASEECVGNTCKCKPKTCADAQASCGAVLDGCGHMLDCGSCMLPDTCGGGGAPNRCGMGVCVPRPACDAGIECGRESDGCSGQLDCGSCDAGTCGSDGRCCMPLTACPTGKQCGAWPDSCGGMLDCGPCTLPETCMGGGVPNKCGCTPLSSCPQFACGPQPNGCGGTLNCPNGCPGGLQRSCTSLDGGPARCNCNSGLTECNGACVDLMTSPANCGACGHACPGGQSCHGGLCPCVDAGSNLDGHCCPQGWVLSPYLGSAPPANMRCFKGPFDAGTEADGLLQCAAETDAGFGRAVPALGSNNNAPPQAAAPAGACGSFLRGINMQVIDAQTSGFGGTATCNPGCNGNTCVCTTCSCSGMARSCAQKFYCVMDPLGPRVEGACQNGGECPPGMTCALGNCVDAGVPFCITTAECSVGTCNYRGNGQTGLCQ